MCSLDFRHTITVQHTGDRKNRDTPGPNSPPGSPNIPRLRAIARELTFNTSMIRQKKVVLFEYFKPFDY